MNNPSSEALQPSSGEAEKDIMKSKPKAEKKEQYMYKCKHGVVHNDITFCKICLKEAVTSD